MGCLRPPGPSKLDPYIGGTVRLLFSAIVMRGPARSPSQASSAHHQRRGPLAIPSNGSPFDGADALSDNARATTVLGKNVADVFASVRGARFMTFKTGACAPA
jgi:hypothetical protein